MTDDTLALRNLREDAEHTVTLANAKIDALSDVLLAIRNHGELACVSADHGFGSTGGKKPASKDVWQFPRYLLVELDAALATVGL